MTQERISLQLGPFTRIQLDSQIRDLLDQRGMCWQDLYNLNCGIEAGWPLDKDKQPTLAQLVMVVEKLNVNIVISDLCVNYGSE